jgi:hypothetical protein
MAEGKDSALQHKSLFRIINITSPKSNPTSAPTFYSRVTDAFCQPRSSFDWRGQGYWIGVLAPCALDLGVWVEARTPNFV